MKREELTDQEYYHLLEIIGKVLMKSGLKATTMDSLAAALKMSKRTLYEIFDSKEAMFKEAGLYFHKKFEDALKKIFQESSNVMEAILKCFLFNRNLMSNLNIDFIREMNEFAEKNLTSKNDQKQQAILSMYNLLLRGVEEGYFRKDVNLMVQCRMLSLQMESLKRMEELFPPDITLLEVYDNISLSFLRGLCSPQGLEELDKTLPLLNINDTNQEIYNA